MSRLRPRFKRSMFRAPNVGGKAKYFPRTRGDVMRDFRAWAESARASDPEAFDLALDLEADIDEDVTGEAHTDMSRLPSGLRHRVQEMQKRMSASSKALDTVWDEFRPPRTEARRYRGRR